MTPPTPDPTPANANSEVALDEAEVLRTDADTHFRYSTASTGRPERRPTGRTAFVSTTAVPVTPVMVHWHVTTPRSAPTSTPPSYTTTGFDEEDGADEEDDGEDEDTVARTSSGPLSTTPRSVTTTTTRPSRPRPTPSSRPAARPSAVFVTPVPTQRAHRGDATQVSARLRQAGRWFAMSTRLSSSALQEVEWNDGAPHSSWSEEEEVEISRVAGVALQQREPKKIDWNSLSRQGIRQGKPGKPGRPSAQGKPASRQQQSKAVPPPAPQDPQDPQDVAVPVAEPVTVAEPWSSWQECGQKGADSGRGGASDGVAEPSEWPWHVRALKSYCPAPPL